MGGRLRDSALSSEQRRLVEMGVPLVHQCAEEVAWRYRDRTTPKELLAPGTLGLNVAARNYRDHLHPNFMVYARFHIQGRMLDAIRSDHFSLRARVEHAMERAFARILAHQTLDVDLFTDDDDQLLAGARQGCGDVLASAFMAGAVEAQRGDPEEEMVAREEYTATLDLLREAVTTLPPHERAVMDLVYEKGMTLDEVGREVRAHANTVQRRHVSALRRLRTALVQRGATAAPRPLDSDAAPAP